MRVIDADPVIANNQFLATTAPSPGGAVYLQASFAHPGQQLLRLQRHRCRTARDGGALAAISSSPRFEGNSFVGNRGRDGGAVHFTTSTGFLLANSMLNNTATRDGGAVICVSASPQITHNRFLGNTAAIARRWCRLPAAAPRCCSTTSCAGTPRPRASRNRAGGGGVFADNISQPRVLNNTLVSEPAPVGGLLLSNRNAVVANNIIAFGSSGIGGGSVPEPPDQQRVRQRHSTTSGSTTSPAARAISPRIPSSPATSVRRGQHPAGLPVSGCGQLLARPRRCDRTLTANRACRARRWIIGADETDGVTTYFLPTVVRVAPDGDDTHDGADVERARSGRCRPPSSGPVADGGEVWVKAGTYVENLVLRPFTSLYGGFAGGETNRVERDWRTRETILDGNRRPRRCCGFRTCSSTRPWTASRFATAGPPAGGGMFAQGEVRILNNRFTANHAVAGDQHQPSPRAAARCTSAAGTCWSPTTSFVRNRAATTTVRLTADGGAIKVAGWQRPRSSTICSG